MASVSQPPTSKHLLKTFVPLGDSYTYSQPDVLLIFCDELNGDLFEPWANHTPAIYKLMARNGTTTFVESYSNVPKCAPSRVAANNGKAGGSVLPF